MSRRAVILIGGPDTGKTNFIARLWAALKAKTGTLRATEIPADISFVEETIAHLFKGEFAPRSELTDDRRRDFVISVVTDDGRAKTELVVPDVSGELWRKAVVLSELPAAWMEELRRADGAILFVRVLSELIEQPLDWVTSRKLLCVIGASNERAGLPTQVMLCELLRFLEISLANRPDGSRPRVAVVVTAWDAVDREVFAAGPEAYLSSQYPLLAGRLYDLGRLEIRVFGMSIVGGDLGADPKFRDEFLDKPFEETGWVTTRDGSQSKWRKDPDVTLPLAWVVGA